MFRAADAHFFIAFMAFTAFMAFIAFFIAFMAFTAFMAFIAFFMAWPLEGNRALSWKVLMVIITEIIPASDPNGRFKPL